MMRRIEVAWPVLNSELRQRLVDECLVAYLHDNTDAWVLQVDGTYQRARPPVNSRSLRAQTELMKRYSLKA
jgi:polyphosphate kinase